MRLSALNLQNFRNIELARLELNGADAFLVGPNGQGKSNLLEAAGLLSALRSFRTTDHRALVRHGQNEAAIYAQLETAESHNVLLRLGQGWKSVEVDGNGVKTLTAFVGQFPTVTLSSEDIQLLRSGPGNRRRWLDSVLASAFPEYLHALSAYQSALKSRNLLLKQASTNLNQLQAFERPLASNAATLTRLRNQWVQQLGETLCQTYNAISNSAEQPSLVYKPDRIGDESSFIDFWNATRERDRFARVTRHGPHRDDFHVLLNDVDARLYASEGQQRSLVLALRFAQANFLHKHTGTSPIILADDVVNELDPQRQSRFWEALGPDVQVLATGTRQPGKTPRCFEFFEVQAGKIAPARQH